MPSLRGVVVGSRILGLGLGLGLAVGLGLGRGPAEPGLTACPFGGVAAAKDLPPGCRVTGHDCCRKKIDTQKVSTRKHRYMYEQPGTARHPLWPCSPPMATRLPSCDGHDRNKWLGRFSDRSTPAYLNREYPDDYRWDNADLGADPTTLERYREAELIHARWAM